MSLLLHSRNDLIGQHCYFSHWNHHGGPSGQGDSGNFGSGTLTRIDTYGFELRNSIWPERSHLSFNDTHHISMLAGGFSAPPGPATYGDVVVHSYGGGRHWPSTARLIEEDTQFLFLFVAAKEDDGRPAFVLLNKARTVSFGGRSVQPGFVLQPTPQPQRR